MLSCGSIIDRALGLQRLLGCFGWHGTLCMILAAIEYFVERLMSNLCGLLSLVLVFGRHRGLCRSFLDLPVFVRDRSITV